MKNNTFFLKIIIILFLVCSCSSNNDVFVPIPELEGQPPTPPEEPIREVDNIPASTQRSGDAAIGYEYLVSGDYMSSGIPYDAFIRGFGEDNTNLLNRTGDNTVILYDYTAVTVDNGVRVVAPNCLSCHASVINDDFVIGLGNHEGDFTSNRALAVPLLSSTISLLYGGEDTDEWRAYEQFQKSITAIGPKTMTESRGVNPADKIAIVLASHREKNTLEWQDEPFVAIDDAVIPTDVPAWWLLKKKNAMFYSAIGRKDFCKSFIGASLLTLSDVSKAEEVDQKMVDVLAYIYSLEAPEYPFNTNTNLVGQGKSLFEQNCTSCHGNYGDNESYPNLLVALNTIGTDPELSNQYTGSSTLNNYFLDWFNTGWFGTDENPLEIKPEGGYIAPPLDGIWATAPYFHNGSVPTLEDVLNSINRPTLWSRTFSSTDYDTDKVGWNYTVENSKVNINTYDSSLKGYGNSGHTFGDDLTKTEKTALIEYLKTL